jgi:hypothetical protein
MKKTADFNEEKADWIKKNAGFHEVTHFRC